MGPKVGAPGGSMTSNNEPADGKLAGGAKLEYRFECPICKANPDVFGELTKGYCNPTNRYKDPARVRYAAPSPFSLASKGVARIPRLRVGGDGRLVC